MPKSNTSPDDYKGQEFNYWTIISRDLEATRPSMFLARCKCGTIRSVNLTNLKNNLSRSCGCLANEELGDRRRTHGLSRGKSQVYTAWANMKQRCYNKDNPQYKDWGGRGIKICDRWLESFESFLTDVGEPPTKLHTIERKDVNGDYTPENTIWATRQEQNENKRNSSYYTYNGVTKTVTAWAKEYNMIPGALHYRLIIKGMSFEESISKPMEKRIIKVTYLEREWTIAELAKTYKIPHKVLAARLKHGWSVEKAVTEPYNRRT